MKHLEEQKQKLEQELEKLNQQLAEAAKIKEDITSMRKDINTIKELFPSVKLEVQENSDMRVKEFAISNNYYSYAHEINVDEITNNKNKYKERIDIAYSLIKQLPYEYALPQICVFAGIFTHNISENIKTPYGTIQEEILMNGRFNDENNLDLRFRIGYLLDTNLSDEYDIELNGFNFKVETSFQSDGYDTLEANNDYICTLENIKPNELLTIIEKLKETTRSHSMLLNFDRIGR